MATGPGWSDFVLCAIMRLVWLICIAGASSRLQRWKDGVGPLDGVSVPSASQPSLLSPLHAAMISANTTARQKTRRRSPRFVAIDVASQFCTDECVLQAKLDFAGRGRLLGLRRRHRGDVDRELRDCDAHLLRGGPRISAIARC